MTVRRLLAVSLLVLVSSACQPTPVPSGTLVPETRTITAIPASATVPPATTSPLATAPPPTPVLESTPTLTAPKGVFSPRVLAILDRRSPFGGNASVFDSALIPLLKEAKNRREADPSYARLADWDLNRERLNFLLFGYGDSLEPSPENPEPQPAKIGSPTLVTLNLITHQVALVSLTHDLRSPEVEKALGILGKPLSAQRLDRAYLDPAVGSFKLLREVLTGATGLYPDYIIAFSDLAIKDLVDEVFLGLAIDVPEAFDVQPFFLEGVTYQAGHFEKGPQRFDGRRAIQYIKTVPKAEKYPPSLEHNVRKQQVFSALNDGWRKAMLDPTFWLRVVTFPKRELDRKRIVYDFDHFILIGSLETVAGSLSNYAVLGKSLSVGWPYLEPNLALYIVDKSCSLDPQIAAVRWVDANVLDDEFMQRDLANGIYPKGFGIEVPYFANPYGNLPQDYWREVRKYIWFRLMKGY